MWSYAGEVLSASAHHVRVRAAFTGPPQEVAGLALRPGDLFVEDYFSDRWYNVYAVSSPDSQGFKGWYCNITRPARWGPADIYFEDLALDLIVLPDGRTTVMDETEFVGLGLPAGETDMARQALADLRRRAALRLEPFDQGAAGARFPDVGGPRLEK